MQWLFAAVVLYLLVKSSGFRKVSAFAVGVVALVVGAYVAYDYAFLDPQRQREKREEEARRLAEYHAEQAGMAARVQAAHARAADQQRREQDRLHQDALAQAMAESSIPPETLHLGHMGLFYESIYPDRATLGAPGIFQDRFELRGRITNPSDRFDLHKASFRILIKDCHGESCQVIGEGHGELDQVVPTKQGRDLFVPIRFGHKINIKGQMKFEGKITATLSFLSPEIAEQELSEGRAPVKPALYAPTKDS